MKASRRQRTGPIAAFLLAAALSACTGEPADTATSVPAAGDADAVRALPAPEPEPVATAMPASPEPAKKKIVVPDPEKLLGMKRSEIVKMLGQPDFRRHDDPALLMRYRNARCILDLFLYPPVGKDVTAAHAVKHVEARDVRGGHMATRTCIESVMQTRAGKVPG